MGYRSDLALALKPEALAPFEEACVEVAASPGASFRTPFHKDTAEQHATEEGHLLVWRSCKCYDWDQILKAFRRRLKAASQANPIGSYYFLRLGEDDADTERGGGWDDNPFEIGLSRSLAYDA